MESEYDKARHAEYEYRDLTPLSEMLQLFYEDTTTIVVYVSKDVPLWYQGAINYRRQGWRAPMAPRGSEILSYWHRIPSKGEVLMGILVDLFNGQRAGGGARAPGVAAQPP